MILLKVSLRKGDAEMALVDFTESLVLPAPREQETKVHGYPEGSHINFVSWSDDSKFIAFTIRSPGEPSCSFASHFSPVSLFKF